MSACSPLAASQGTPPSGRSDRSSVISVSPGGHLQRADLVAQPRRRLELLALDRLLQLRRAARRGSRRARAAPDSEPGTSARRAARSRAHAAGGRGGSARTRRSSARSPGGRSRGNRAATSRSTRSAPRRREAGAPAAAPPGGTHPSGCFGIETVVSMPRSAAHFSHRWSCVTAFSTICVRFRTASRSWHWSQSIRRHPRYLYYRQVGRLREGALGRPGRRASGCASPRRAQVPSPSRVRRTGRAEPSAL